MGQSQSDGLWGQILSGVILTIVVGSTAPWWWNFFFRNDSIVGSWELVNTAGDSSCASEVKMNIRRDGVILFPSGFSPRYRIEDDVMYWEHSYPADKVPVKIRFEINKDKLYIYPIKEDLIHCNYVYQRLK